LSYEQLCLQLLAAARLDAPVVGLAAATATTAAGAQ
jgi:hypothetical protein